MPLIRTYNSQFAYKDLLEATIQPGCRWLDIGCGESLFADWIRNSIEAQRQLIARCEVAHGCDPVDDRPHKAGLQKYVGDCSSLPYADGFFNLVTANMVVEHVVDPLSFAKEVHRVLAVGGKFIFHTPNLFYPPILIASMLPAKVVRLVAHILDGRPDEDIFPTYYRMNTRKAISSLPGFQALDVQCVQTGPLFKKVPIVNFAESLFIEGAQYPWLKKPSGRLDCGTGKDIS